MTSLQKRNKVIDYYSKIIGRNIYSQDLSKREYAFTPYKNGKYYSDCSSSVRLSYKNAGIIDNIGNNTIVQYQSSIGKRIDAKIKNGVPTDISKLRIGDCLYFAGSDNSREYADFCGHVEMIYSIDGANITLCGHGCGKPSFKDMNKYCKNRFNSKTSTKKGNKGLIGIVRFIDDDQKIKPIKPTSTISSKSKQPEVLWFQQKANKILDKIELFGSNGIKLNKLNEDGIFGPRCKEFVKSFWNLMGWKNNSNIGNCGPNTIKALDLWK